MNAPATARPESDTGAARLAVPFLLIAVAFGCLAVGPVPFAVLVGLLLVLSYLELRRLLGGAGSRLSLVLGVIAVVAMTVLGALGRPQDLPWGMAGLLLALLAGRVVLLETARRGVEGATADIASTSAAAGLVGLLGAHVLLMRALPSSGPEATLLFGAVFVTDSTLAAVGTKLFGRHKLARRVSDTRTWEGAALGLAGAAIVGVIVTGRLGLPFSTMAAAALATMVAILATVGDLGSSAVKRSAGLGERAGWVPGVGEIFNATDGVLLSAPFFYWSFRTLVL